MPSPKSVIQKKTGVREDLAASCANEQPSVTNQSALGIRSLSRRGFIGRVGGATAAAWTASAIGLSPLLGSKSVKAEAATILGRQRAIEAYDLRKDAALAEYHLPIVSHPNNGDEDLYSNKIGNYSKGLPHNNVGEVDLTAYNSYLAAIRSGLPADFDNIILGGNTKLTDPQCGLAFAMEGGIPVTHSSLPAQLWPARSGRMRRLKTTGWRFCGTCRLQITRRMRRLYKLVRS